jgi:sn-glycerol 3-phosphate transport system substrate-binding protein
MTCTRYAIVPVCDVSKRNGLQFDPTDFIAPARSYDGLASGDLLTMPLNVSATVLF